MFNEKTSKSKYMFIIKRLQQIIPNDHPPPPKKKEKKRKNRLNCLIPIFTNLLNCFPRPRNVFYQNLSRTTLEKYLHLDVL